MTGEGTPRTMPHPGSERRVCPQATRRANQLWVADLTDLARWAGFVYVAFVIDGERIDPERGEAAGRIFTAIREGKTLVQVVVELRYAPDLVREMAADFAQLLGGVALSPADVQSMRERYYALRDAMDRGTKPLAEALLRSRWRSPMLSRWFDQREGSIDEGLRLRGLCIRVVAARVEARARPPADGVTSQGGRGGLDA